MMPRGATTAGSAGVLVETGFWLKWVFGVNKVFGGEMSVWVKWVFEVEWVFGLEWNFEISKSRK